MHQRVDEHKYVRAAILYNDTFYYLALSGYTNLNLQGLIINHFPPFPSPNLISHTV